jgi:predicted phage terminase large subunit-like protein
MIQQLKSIINANIIEDKPPSESKVSRVSSASASIEAGRVFIHEDCPGFDTLTYESRMFPNGKNDDTIDALASVIRIELPRNNDILIGMF